MAKKETEAQTAVRTGQGSVSDQSHPSLHQKSKPDPEDLRKYEAMVIFIPDLGEESTQKKIEELRKMLKEAEGEIFHEDDWGLRDLAYKIKGRDKGYYFVVNFSMLPNKLKKIDKHLKLEKEVLRHIILTVPDTYEVKSLKEYEQEAEMQKEKERIERTKEEEKRFARPEKPTRVEKPAEKPKRKVKEKAVKTTEPTKPTKPTETTEPTEPVEFEEKKKPVKEPRKDDKKTLSDLDEKLQSIINDPDIIL